MKAPGTWVRNSAAGVEAIRFDAATGLEATRGWVAADLRHARAWTARQRTGACLQRIGVVLLVMGPTGSSTLVHRALFPPRRSAHWDSSSGSPLCQWHWLRRR